MDHLKNEPRDGIWLFDMMVLVGAAILGVCTMVGICVTLSTVDALEARAS
jgi:hypothetical protein